MLLARTLLQRRATTCPCVRYLPTLTRTLISVILRLRLQPCNFFGFISSTNLQGYLLFWQPKIIVLFLVYFEFLWAFTNLFVFWCWVRLLLSLFVLVVSPLLVFVHLYIYISHMVLWSSHTTSSMVWGNVIVLFSVSFVFNLHKEDQYKISINSALHTLSLSLVFSFYLCLLSLCTKYPCPTFPWNFPYSFTCSLANPMHTQAAPALKKEKTTKKKRKHHLYMCLIKL